MEPGAHVTSVEELERFRGNLLIYQGKAKGLLNDACDEVARTREWLRTDRQMHWENQVRRCRRKLEEAQRAAFDAKLSPMRAAMSGQQNAVHSARRALSLAEEKLVKVKQWINRFDNLVSPSARELERLRGLVTTELPKGALYLGEVMDKLERYAETRGSNGSGPGPAEEAAAREPAEGEQ